MMLEFSVVFTSLSPPIDSIRAVMTLWKYVCLGQFSCVARFCCVGFSFFSNKPGD